MLLKIGIDLDNTITASKESKQFFSTLTTTMSGVAIFYIITNREQTKKSRKETEQELEELDINYDELVITADKAKYVIDNEITIYFDDTDEYFANMPSSVTVFKIREPGNFDFEEKKWFYGDKTGINIDENRG